MRKAFFVTVIVIFGCTTANAQGVSFGLKFGATLVDMRGDVENNTMEISPSFGILTEFMFTKSFGIQTELLYAMLGTKLEVAGNEGKLNLNYIVLPVLFKLYIVEEFSLQAGPQVGYLMFAKVDSGSREDVTYLFSDTDYGVSMGASYHLDMGMFFNANYYLGLSDIQELYGLTGPSSDPEIYNQGIQLSVGYIF